MLPTCSWEFDSPYPLQQGVKMNYTETYKKIYSIISETNLPHEKVHKASLRIADALNDICVYTNRQFPEMMDKIMEAAEDFYSKVKIGGYDLDDSGLPIGAKIYKDGTSFTGLDNSKK